MKQRTLIWKREFKDRAFAQLIKEINGANRDSRLVQIATRMSIAAYTWNLQMNHFYSLDFKIDHMQRIPTADKIREMVAKHVAKHFEAVNKDACGGLR